MRDSRVVAYENIGDMRLKVTKMSPYILDQKHHLPHFFLLKMLCGKGWESKEYTNFHLFLYLSFSFLLSVRFMD